MVDKDRKYIEKIRSLVNTNTFAHNVVNQFDRRGTLSDATWPHVKRLALQQDIKPNTSQAIDPSKLIEIFTFAAQKLKYPKIRINHPSLGKIIFSRAGTRSKFPGSINITDDGPYGNNTWYGRIRENSYEPSQYADSEVMEFVSQYVSDPIGESQRYGKLTGSCCFCNRTLEDERSTSVGYGPICAGKWNLPWG